MPSKNSFIAKFAILLLLFFSSNLHASIGLPNAGDPEYVLYQAEKPYPVRVIYEAKSVHVLYEALFWLEQIQGQYEREFGWTLDEPLVLVLVPEHNQIPNAFTAWNPFLYNVYFSGGAGNPVSLLGGNWVYNLVSHEMAHSFQVNVKASPVSRFLKKVLGNPSNQALWVGFIPAFVSPNAMVPSLFLEGNATWNESRWNRPGRLLYGTSRALTSALAWDDDMDLSRLINYYDEFPYGTDKYLLGSEFYKFLQQKYQKPSQSSERINGYFYQQSNSFILPFLLDKNFRSSFRGDSLRDSLEEFLHRLKSERRKHRLLPQKPIAVFKNIPTLTKSGSKILLNGTFDNKFKRIFSINSKGEVTQTKTLLPSGPVFESCEEALTSKDSCTNSDQTFWSSSFIPVRVQRQQFAAINEDRTIDESTVGLFTFEKNFGHELSYRIEKSWKYPFLVVDRQDVGIVETQPRLDPIGNVIWWFDQVGSDRVLKKSVPILGKSQTADYSSTFLTDSFGAIQGQEVLRFPSYQAYVVDVTDREVFFITQTATGSGLFSYDKTTKEVYRKVASDGVFDARVLNDSSAGANRKIVLLEARSQGLALHLVEDQAEQSWKEMPAEMSFAIPIVKDLSDQALERNSQAKLDEEKSASQKIAKESSPYSPWQNFKYSGLNLITSMSVYSPAISAQAAFDDLLQMHQALIGYSYLGGEQTAFTAYYNSFYRLQWALLADYQESGTYELEEDTKRYKLVQMIRKHTIGAGVAYPLYRSLLSKWNLSLISAYSRTDQNVTDSQATANLSYSWSANASEGTYYPLRSFQMNAIGQQSKVDRSYSFFGLRWTEGFWAEWGTALSVASLQSETRSIDLNPYLLMTSPLQFRTFASRYDDVVKEWKYASLEVRKVLHWPLLFYKFPLGIRRWIPFAGSSINTVDGGAFSRDQFFEQFFGLRVELLLNHGIPLLLEVKSSVVTQKDRDLTLTLQHQARF